MLKLANIIPYCPYENSDLFNVYDSIEEINMGLPTLIIGWETAKSIYGSNALDPLNRRINEGVFWTFDKKEYREYYLQDTYDFLMHAKEKLYEGLFYVNADPIQHGKSYNRILSKIRSFDYIVSFIINDVIYVYSDKFVIGFDLELHSWLNNREEIFTEIESLSNVFLKDPFYVNYYSDYMVDLDKEMKFVPYLYAKETNG